MSTEITEHKVKLKEVIKGSEGELIVLQDFNQTKESLVKMAEKYKNLVVTKENFSEGKEARAELREIRYGLQNITKHNNDFINKAKAEMKTVMDELIETLKPTEDKIDEQIKAIEQEKKIEKQRKEKEEAERIAKVNREIADARVKFEKLVSFGRTDDDVKQFCSFVDELAERNSKDEFEEFGFEIDNLLQEYNDRLPELRDRVEKIKQDAIREEENKKKELLNNRIEKLLGEGLVKNHLGIYEYKGFIMPLDILKNGTEQEFNSALKTISDEHAKDLVIEANLKIESDKKAKEKEEAEAKKKAEEEAKLKAEREKFEKEKAEFEAKKKAETFEHRKQVLLDMGFEYVEPAGDNYNFILKGIWSSFQEQIENVDDEGFKETVKQIKDAIERNEIKLAEEKKAKEEAEKQAKIKKEKEFGETVEKARKLGVSFNDLDTNGEKQVVIDTLKERITQAEHLLTVEKKKALKEAGAVHIETIIPIHKQVFDYFGSCKIEPEHENAIVEFEDELRASFKKLKNSIS